MKHWEQLSALLKEEAEIWQKIYQYNNDKRIWTTKEEWMEEGESFIEQKESLLNDLFRIQKEISEAQLHIEKTSVKATQLIREQIEQSIRKIETLQKDIQKQEEKMSQILLNVGNQIREEIKKNRNRKTMQTGYRSMPILEESALLDEKN